MKLYLGLNEKMKEPLIEKMGGYKVLCYSTPSPDRETRNEDSFGVGQFGPYYLFAVADGLGGHEGGDLASRLAIQSLMDFSEEPGLNLEHDILSAVEKINKKLKKSSKDIGTTLTFALLYKNKLRFYSVGDSVGVLLSKGVRKYKTVEHSVTGLASESGVIRESEAMDHPERHVILNSLGDEGGRTEISFPLSFEDNDRILLVSDGVTDNVAISELEQLFAHGSIEDSFESLLKECQLRMQSGGKADDMTIVVVEKS